MSKAPAPRGGPEAQHGLSEQTFANLFISLNWSQAAMGCDSQAIHLIRTKQNKTKKKFEKAHQTAALVSLNVGGISFKRQSMVCEGEREKGRWEWGEGAVVPGGKP